MYQGRQSVLSRDVAFTAAAASYQNPFTCVKAIASQRWDVFWDTVYKSVYLYPRASSRGEVRKEWEVGWEEVVLGVGGSDAEMRKQNDM